MAKGQSKQATQKPAQRGQKPKAVAETPAVEQAPLVEQLGRQGQAAGFPNHRTSDRLRRATVLNLQPRHGNGYVQRWLNPQRGAQSLHGSNGLRRQVEENDQPTKVQKAAAQAAAQAAEGNAAQAALRRNVGIWPSDEVERFVTKHRGQRGE